MTSIMHVLYSDLIYAMDKYEDKFTATLFLVKSPKVIIAILAIWFAFVLKLGPWYMQYRKPFNIDKVLIYYNAFQAIVCSIGIALMTPYVIELNPFCRSGIPDDPDGLSYFCSYMYYLLKIVDLLDTIFFVLRKKFSQITFLHVLHHSGMVIATWIGIKFAIHEHMGLLPYVNSIVHAVMYTYYLLSIYDKNYKNSIWWKKHITQLQLAQFTILFILYVPALFKQECTLPKPMALLVILQNAIMMALFMHFYYKTYIKKKTPSIAVNENINSDNSNKVQ